MYKINQGGTITWTGDPMNAKIDVDASYSVRTPPYNFILEYIGQNQRLADLAQNATDVDLFLHLRGDLFSPDITFDMEFPELTGQVKNYVEDRLRVITDDQNRSEEHTSELQSRGHLVCRLLLEKKKNKK